MGYSTAQAYLVLKERLSQVQPHVVMLFYTQENDMWWNARPGSWNPYFSLKGQDLLYQAPTRIIADLIKDDILPRMAQNPNSIFDFRISPSGGQ